MKIHTKIAKKISYGGKRPYKDIKYIVIHFTANTGDTAKNNAVFYIYQIQLERITIDDVPVKYRKDVEKALNDVGK